MILHSQQPEHIAAAAALLRAGEVVGLPTETVYGLAADAEQDGAVARIFALKGRPAEHPLIVHIADASAVPHFAHSVPDFAERLMAACWPGPLTLILPRQIGVAAAAAGGQESIGLRCPAHPVAQALLQALRQHTADGAAVLGLAAPSANRFGRVSPTAAAHVEAEFGVQLTVLDGGPCAIGIESSIVDCSRGAPVLLRPGQLGAARIEALCGQRLLLNKELLRQTGPAPRASGTLPSHYAPAATLRLLPTRELQRAVRLLAASASALPPAAPAPIGVYARCALPAAGALVRQRRMPDQADATAHELFAVLRDFDADGVRLLWVQVPPADPDWDGVRDRLQRAATPA